jgi:hypothetical protein
MAKECHRFLVAGPFKFLAVTGKEARSRGYRVGAPVPGSDEKHSDPESSAYDFPPIKISFPLYPTAHCLTRRTTDAGASTSNSTAPSLYFRE